LDHPVDLYRWADMSSIRYRNPCRSKPLASGLHQTSVPIRRPQLSGVFL